MTIEEMRDKYIHFMQRVELMRDRQKMFFQGRCKSDLEASKRMEKEIDDFIRREKQDIKSGQIQFKS